MPFHVTILYAGLNGLILLALAWLAASARRLSGDGNGDVKRTTRAHTSAAEIVPVVLILMGLLEAYRVPALLVHGLGIALTVSQLLHAWGMLRRSDQMVGRDLGNTLAWIVLVVASVSAIAIGLGFHVAPPG
jgi:uncharacterized membrane protein YecN with MAPEG domain